jgi:hypothetical protein
MNNLRSPNNNHLTCIIPFCSNERKYNRPFCKKHCYDNGICSHKYCYEFAIDGHYLCNKHIQDFWNNKKLECNIPRCILCKTHVYDKLLCLYHYLQISDISLEKEVNNILEN